MPKEILSELGLDQMRDYVVRGLAESIPKFLSREQAEELLEIYFPSDTLALSSLYRLVNGKRN